MSFPVPVKYGTDEVEYSDGKTLTFPPGGDGSGGGGSSDWKDNYDLIIDVDLLTNPLAPTLIKGDYDTIYNMCVNKTPIRVAVYNSNPWEEGGVTYPWYEHYQILSSGLMVEDTGEPFWVDVTRWNNSVNQNVAISSNGTSVTGRASGLIPGYNKIVNIHLNSDNSVTASSYT